MTESKWPPALWSWWVIDGKSVQITDRQILEADGGVMSVRATAKAGFWLSQTMWRDAAPTPDTTRPPTHIRVRIHVLVDRDGTYSALGQRDEMDMSVESRELVVNATIPLPEPVKPDETEGTVEG